MQCQMMTAASLVTLMLKVVTQTQFFLILRTILSSSSCTNYAIVIKLENTFFLNKEAGRLSWTKICNNFYRQQTMAEQGHTRSLSSKQDQMKVLVK